jgi:hypothetical protein
MDLTPDILRVTGHDVNRTLLLCSKESLVSQVSQFDYPITTFNPLFALPHSFSHSMGSPPVSLKLLIKIVAKVEFCIRKLSTYSIENIENVPESPRWIVPKEQTVR